MSWPTAWRFSAWVLASFVLLCAGAAMAVLVHGKKALDPDDPDNDLPGSGYVGRIGSHSGVYLGDGWVLSAHHVTGNGSPDFVLDGTPYKAQGGSGVWLKTRPDITADLQLLRLADAPELAPLSLSGISPAVGSTVVMIGNSSGQAGRLINWNTHWQEVKRSESAHVGYNARGRSDLWWGRNQVSEPSQFMKIGPSVTRAFGMRFDREGAVPGEAAVLVGDSGGAVFAREAGEWRLAGILFARQTEPGQAGHVAVFGNISLAVDLSFYRKQILAVTTNE